MSPVKPKTSATSAAGQVEEVTRSVVTGCVVQLLKNEGPAALFAGASGRMAYLAPNMALFVPMYDVLKTYATAA